MPKVAVIGVGNLGSRHLQGVAKYKAPLSIFLVDPLARSIALARERFVEVLGSKVHTLHSVESVRNLPCDLDFAIISCTADHRFNVYRDLLESTDTKIVLLEKILFQDLDHYELAVDLARNSKSRVIVNFSKRYWPFFRGLRSEVTDKSRLSIVMSGSNWGLGCNAVHHVDIAEFIWGVSGRTSARLDDTVLQGKRQGFLEFTGAIETLVPGGGSVSQISYSSGEVPFLITSMSPSHLMVWDVSNSRLHRADASSGWLFKSKHLQAPLQSDLTAGLVEAVLNGAAIDLPDIEAASATHLATLSEILDCCRANGHDFGRICPVT